MSNATVSRNDLPTEMDPRGWDVSHRSAICAAQVPINDAFDSLNACYKNGGDLASCSQTSGYKDTFGKYQDCLAGDISSSENDACADASLQQTSSPNNTASWLDDVTPSTPASSQTISDSTQNPKQEGKWIPLPIESLIAFICALLNTVMLVVVVYFVLKNRTR